MKYNDALTRIRDFFNGIDIDELLEAMDTIIKTKGFDPPLPDFEDMFGYFSEQNILKRSILFRRFERFTEE